MLLRSTVYNIAVFSNFLLDRVKPSSHRHMCACIQLFRPRILNALEKKLSVKVLTHVKMIITIAFIASWLACVASLRKRLLRRLALAMAAIMKATNLYI